MAKDVSFAARVKSLRKMKGMTQDEVVAVLRNSGYKISKSGYQKWEKEEGLKRPPNIVALSALAEYYEIPVHLLIDWQFQSSDKAPGTIDHFTDIDLLPEEKIDTLKNLYDMLLTDHLNATNANSKGVKDAD
jgi:transcriptional regulator with XRE-family HTH domain|tara:strand:+ start:486 stop:881 length:396 start_codon:yes stop_codon:yes gene_type:complete